MRISIALSRAVLLRRRSRENIRDSLQGSEQAQPSRQAGRSRAINLLPGLACPFSCVEPCWTRSSGICKSSSLIRLCEKIQFTDSKAYAHNLVVRVPGSFIQIRISTYQRHLTTIEENSRPSFDDLKKVSKILLTCRAELNKTLPYFL